MFDGPEMKAELTVNSWIVEVLRHGAGVIGWTESGSDIIMSLRKAGLIILM